MCPLIDFPLAHADFEIIIETAYNIGEPKLFMFKNMRAKMQEGDWAGMANELRDSKLYRTLTSRYEPLAKIIEES